MLEELRSFPETVRVMIESVGPEQLRTRSRDGHFALIEHAWHLADLEVEGYGERIRRVLTEDNPVLPDFDGGSVAEERRYLELELAPALDRFAKARAANLVRVLSCTDAQWQRGAQQEGVGPVTLERVVEMMAEHDAGHAAELHALLDELTSSKG